MAMHIPSKRRPGRPALDADDPSIAVSTRLPSKEYDAAYRRARLDRVTVAELLRRALRRHGKL